MDCQSQHRLTCPTLEEFLDIGMQVEVGETHAMHMALYPNDLMV